MDFTGQSPEQAMQAASRDLGLPDAFFDTMWNTESGRGANMRSRAGAMGHFQTMPATRAAFEKRLGRALDPDNFADSLTLAHATMKENLGKFKDPVKATAAYNGGWDESKWGNAETTAYVQKLWGAQASVPALKQAAGHRAQTLDRGAAALTGIGAVAEVNSFQALADAQAREHAAKEAVGFSTVVAEKWNDPRSNGLWSVVKELAEQPDDPTFDYYSQRKELEGDLLTEGEVEYMRENAKSASQAMMAKDEILRRRKVDREVYGRAGGFTNFVAELGVGLADPVGWAAGMGVGKLFQLTKVGAASLIAAGRGRAAVTALTAESALGNVAWEGVQDFLGEQKTIEDYGLATAFGAAFAVPFVRGVNRQAHEHALAQAARDMQVRAINDTNAHIGAAKSVDTVVREQHAAIDATLREGTTVRPPQGNDAVAVPHELAAMQRELDGDAHAAAPKESAPAAPEVPTEKGEPVTVKDAEGNERRVTLDEMGQEHYPDFEVSRLDADEAAMLREMYDADPSAESFLEMLADAVARQAAADGGLNAPRKVGDTLYYAWGMNAAERKDALARPSVTLREALETSMDRMRPGDRVVAQQMLANANSKVLDGVPVFVMPGAKGQYNLRKGAIRTPGDTRVQSPLEALSSMHADDAGVLLHESIHAFTAHAIERVLHDPKSATAAERLAVRELEQLRTELEADLKAKGMYQNLDSGAGYATKNVHEFVAQVMSDSMTRMVLSSLPGKGYVGTLMNKFVQIMHSLLGFPPKAPVNTALSDAMTHIDVLIRSGGDLPPGVGMSTLNAPSPQTRAMHDSEFADKMYKHAEQWNVANPVDASRLTTLAAQLTGKGSVVRDYFVSDGLKMAASANPIIKMLSGLIVETTTGAAGRRQTAAVKKSMLHQMIVGNSVIDYHAAYNRYRDTNGGGVIEDHLTGKVKRDYDKEVMVEILNRRYGNASTQNTAVLAGADAMEQLFDRSLKTQKQAATLGSGYLPADAKGYAPQSLDGDKLASASTQELAELGTHMAGHWQHAYGWSKDFSETFSHFYIERARRRANGEKGVDFVATESPTAAVRDTLEEMKLQSRSLDAKARAELDRVGAQPQNKRRLDVDPLATLPGGRQVLDFYSTDIEVLSRQHANRVAGAAALAEFNVLGQRGVNNLLRAIDSAPAEMRASKEERDAVTRTFSEFLGVPWQGEKRSAWAQNTSALVRLQRMGGQAFTQLAETSNLVHHLGFTSLLKGVPMLAPAIGDVGRLKKGAASNNPWLAPIERHQGFEFGMEQFKMIAHLDPPDELLRAYGKGNGLAQRLLSSGNYVQNKLSFFRALTAAQHRVTAELIIKKALGYIERGGKGDVYLRDMGISEDLANAMRADLPNAILRDAEGRANGFDITAIQSTKAQDEFLQAVHRGVSQIIQGTFIGERGAWATNDMAKLFLQLRTFGLTSMEKQWGRTRMNSGYGAATGLLLAQMALATPIYLARVQLAAAGREDRDEYIKKATSPASMIQALANYSSMSGMAGDVADITMTMAGGWNNEVRDNLGTKSFAPGVGGLVPAAGSLDAAFKVASGKSDLHTALKQLPGSNLPFLIPFINLTKRD